MVQYHLLLPSLQWPEDNGWHSQCVPGTRGSRTGLIRKCGFCFNLLGGSLKNCLKWLAYFHLRTFPGLKQLPRKTFLKTFKGKCRYACMYIHAYLHSCFWKLGIIVGENNNLKAWKERLGKEMLWGIRILKSCHLFLGI